MRPPRVQPPCSGGLPMDQHRGRSIPTSRPPPCSGSGRGASRPRCSGRRSGATAPPPRPPGRRHAPGGTRAPSSQRLCTAASCAGDAHVRASGVLRPPPPPATPSSGFASWPACYPNGVACSTPAFLSRASGPFLYRLPNLPTIMCMCPHSLPSVSSSASRPRERAATRPFGSLSSPSVAPRWLSVLTPRPSLFWASIARRTE